MSKKISIITVTYNDLGNLKGTVESISKQLTDEVEYIIIDGQSHDGTVKYLSKLNSHIVWISEPDTGIYNAMNKGINLAHGTWIWFINAGDCILENALSIVLAELDKMEGCLVAKVIETFEYMNHIWGKKVEVDTQLNNLKKGMIFCHQGFICKKEVLIESGMFDETLKICGDWDLIIKLYKRNLKFTFIDECICSYDKFGLSYNSHVKEIHRVRKKIIYIK